MKRLFVLSCALAAVLGCKTEVGGLVAGNVDAGYDLDGSVRTDASATCVGDVPAARKSNGQKCSCAAECSSGFCVDGVCCNSACTGTCMACSVATSVGTCTPIPSGQMPVVPGQCKAEVPSSCGLDGTCNGMGACRKYPDGSVCTAGKCMGAQVVGAMTCQAGACKPGPSVVCSPYACDGNTGKCFTTCTAAIQCDGRTCSNGSCGLRPLGAMCTKKEDCDSGFCADGVCCNLACTGACTSCNQAGKMGQCNAVAKDAPDPHGVCKKDTPDTCGSSGLCNGMGGCSKYAAGTVCKAASCSGGSQVPASTCNGLGTCVLGSPINCFPYACVGDSCKATCTTTADCAAGGPTCMNGSCGKKGLGQKCGANGECNSGFCAQGVCCNSACAGTCSYCAFPNALGRCTTVPAGVTDPKGACVDKGAASCGANGKCDGAGACQSYPSGTVCRAGTCDATANRFTDAAVCKNGACTAPAPITCAPYKCNGAACANSCSTAADCVAPNDCQNNSCGKKPNGSLCAQPDECVSNFCAQGVCCGTACTANCFSCNLAGSAGMCQPVLAGAPDPAGTCKDDGAATCGNDGTCNGMGGCRKYQAGTVCAAATCANGTSTSAATCNGMGTCTPGTQGACSPYVCNAGGTACYSSCSDNTQCVAGRSCMMGMCGKKDNGSSCSAGDECKSNACVDGVCCESDCTGVCKSCALAGTLGKCSNIAAGSPDDGGGCATTDQSTCGNDGFCNGMGACRKWSTSTVCRAASCPMSSSTLTKAANCDGAGMCPAGQTQSCGNFVCDPQTSMCKTACSSNADCVAGKACDTGTGSCGKSVNGASCNSGTDCASGNCVDNTCCGSGSCGECQTCANAMGVCANVADNGSDPDSCTDQTGTSACGTIGKCNGMGKCKFAASGTACGQSCSNDKMSLVISTCNGSGMCSGATMMTSCNGFECQNNACLNTCQPPKQGCVGSKICINNTCQDATPDAGI